MNKKQGVFLIKKAIKRLHKSPIVIGIAGGSCSGKSYLSNIIPGKVLHLDDYYRENPPRDGNFDHPSRIRFNLLMKHIQQLKKNKSIEKPFYNFVNHKVDHYEKFLSDKIIIVEGIHALNKKLVKFYDLKVFVDAPEKIRLKRRIRRDMKERGRTKKNIIKQWNYSVVPMYKKFILPTKENADFVVET